MGGPRRFDVALRAGYLVFTAAALVPLLMQAATAGWRPAWLLLVGLVVGAALLQVTPTPPVLPLGTVAAALVCSVVLAGRGLETSPSLMLGLFNYVVVSRLPLRPALVVAPLAAAGYVVLSRTQAPQLGWRPFDDAVLGLSLCLAPIVFVHLLNRQLAEVQQTRRAQAARLLAASLADAESRLRERTRRLLHDEVIGLLTMIADHAGGQEARLRAGAVRVAARLADGVGAEPETVTGGTVGDLLDRAAAHSGLRVEADRADRGLPVRAEHAAAVLRALGETLRNARGHAGVDRVAATARREGGRLVLTVTDDGAVARTAAPGFGLRHSVIGPMRELGGDATLRPGAAGGTTVRLHWPDRADATDADGDRDPPVPRGRLDRAHAELTRALGDQGWLGFLIALPTLAGNLFVALRYSWGDPTWVAQTLLTVPVCVVSVLVVRRLRLRPLHRREVAALSVWTAVVVHVGLQLAEPRALTGYDSWVIGLAAAVMLVTAFFLPWEGVLTLLVPQLAVVGWHAQEAQLAWWQVGGAVNAVVSPLVLGFLFGAYLRRVRRLLDREQAAAHEQARHDHLRATTRAADHELRHVRGVIGPWLHRLGTDEVALGADAVRTRARALARQARDDLYAPGVLGDDLRRRIADARAHGIVVELLPGLSPAPGGACLTVLDRVLDVADVERIVVATTVGGDRVEVGPPLAAPVRASLAPLLANTPHRVVDDDFSTTVKLPGRGPASGLHPTRDAQPAC